MVSVTDHLKGKARSAYRRLVGRQPKPVDYSSEQARPDYVGDRQYVFLTGCSRSGTTALVEVMNRHPDVAIGFERFAYRGRAGTLEPSLFEPERFRDFRPEDTFHSTYVGDDRREPVLHKAHAAKVVGDKIPQLLDSLEQIDRFPGAKIVFIVRDPFSVAGSFEARAANPADRRWPSDRNFVQAVAEFNQAMSAITRYVESGKPALVLEYWSFFSDPNAVETLWRFLGVDPGRVGPLDDLFTLGRKRTDRAADRNQIALAVAESADFETFRHLLRMTGVDRRIGAEVIQ